MDPNVIDLTLIRRRAAEFRDQSRRTWATLAKAEEWMAVGRPDRARELVRLAIDRLERLAESTR